MRKIETNKNEIFYPKNIDDEKAIKLFNVLETYVTRIITPDKIYQKSDYHKF